MQAVSKKYWIIGGIILVAIVVLAAVFQAWNFILALLGLGGATAVVSRELDKSADMESRVAKTIEEIKKEGEQAQARVDAEAKAAQEEPPIGTPDERKDAFLKDLEDV